MDIVTDSIAHVDNVFSDSPALAMDKEMKRNEPKYLKVSCKEVARIKSITQEEVASMTTQNAKKIFTNVWK